jgi:hypothetical protein
MFKEIQQAETAIKAGDTKTGFEILRSYIAENPNSERAWWVMSGLVQREERATCLEQVLRINPNNLLARETLEKLLASPPEKEIKPQRDIPTPQKTELKPEVEVPSPSSLELDLGYPLQAFLYKKRARIYLTLLEGKHIIRAYTKQAVLPQVRDAVQRGELPTQYLSDLKYVPLDSIKAVKHISSALILQYQAGLTDRSWRLPFEDEEKARAILGVLTKQLGPDYMIQTKRVSNAFNLVISALLTLGSAAFVAAILWTLPQIGATTGEESWRIQLVSRLLESLGYTGVIVISMVLVLAALGLSAYLLLKPPVRTELVRRV